MRLFFFIPLLCFACYCSGQVKIGDNIASIDATSLLELDSETRAFVPTRVTDVQMNKMLPLNGALVYNTDYNCIFTFDGTNWKSLCNSGIVVTTAIVEPTANEAGDIWINDTTNQVSVWNGFSWVLINTNLKRGNGPPSDVIVPDPKSGDVYVDITTASIYAYNGTSWQENSVARVGNGLNVSAFGDIEIGGTLTRPTIITTDTANTLAIEGLTEAATSTTTKLVTIDDTTGELHSASAASFLRREEITIRAMNGQQEFTTPLGITDAKKIVVYRNGIKIDFTTAGSNLIELETDIVCFLNDEIRIVQFF